MAEKRKTLEVSKILAKRKIKNGIHYLTRWKGKGPKEDTWEPRIHLQSEVAEQLLKEFNFKLRQQKNTSKNVSQKSNLVLNKKNKSNNKINKSKNKHIPNRKVGEKTVSGPVKKVRLVKKLKTGKGERTPGGSPSHKSVTNKKQKNNVVKLNKRKHLVVSKPKGVHTNSHKVSKPLRRDKSGKFRSSPSKSLNIGKSRSLKGKTQSKKANSEKLLSTAKQKCTDSEVAEKESSQPNQNNCKAKCPVTTSPDAKSSTSRVSKSTNSPQKGNQNLKKTISTSRPNKCKSTTSGGSASPKSGKPKTAKSVMDMCTDSFYGRKNDTLDIEKDTSSVTSHSSSDSGLLYSLPNGELSSVQTQICAKKVRVELMPLPSVYSNGACSPWRSPSKWLLKDSIRPKTKASRIGQNTLPLSPQSPSKYAGPSACRILASNSPPNFSEPSPGNTMESLHPDLVPVSPSTSRYQSLVHNLSHDLYSRNGGVKRKHGQMTDVDDLAERRTSVRQSESAFRYKHIVVKKCPGYTQVWIFSQTKAKNALNPQVFQELIQVLYNAKFDDSRLVMLSGSGSIFCSGIDLHYLTSEPSRKAAAKKMADSLREFVSAVIDFAKPIVAVVNGPAVGLGAAILPLCDIVYASDKATFSCPFVQLCQSPEGCSSYTFPQIMGLAMANELLLVGRKVTAMEAHQVGLVSQVFWPTSLMQEVVPRLQNMASFSTKALAASKVLIRSHQRAKLEMTNTSECQMLAERWASSECQKAMRTYREDEHDLFL